MLKQILAGVLKVAYFDNGSSDGTPVFLLRSGIALDWYLVTLQSKRPNNG